MKKVVASLCVVAGLLFLPACDWFSKKTEAPRVRLVNVLDKEYFDDAHIKGGAGVASINVPYENLQKESASWEKNIPVVTYCSNYMCSASHDAVTTLTDAGFEKVSVYGGGMAEWYQLSKKDPSYEVEGPAKLEYLSSEMKKPAHSEENSKEISAQELQKLIK